MKLASFVFSTVWFYTSILVGHISEATINKDIAGHGLQPEDSLQQNREPIEFMDLNDDVKYHIFELLSLEDLIALVEAVPAIKPLVIAVFRMRYDELEMRYIFPDNTPYSRKYDVEGRRITTYFLNFTLSVLKHFGGVITKLSYQISNSDKNFTTIEIYVNKYCGQSLIQLDLWFRQSFEHFTQPFAHVIDLTFSVQHEVTMGTFTLDQLFPKLERITLNLDGNFDFGFIDRTFAHLEHMFLKIWNESWQRRDQIEQFIRKNNRTRSLEFYFVPDNDRVFSLSEINDMLPHLQNLTVQTFYKQNVPVHFENVKHFVLYAYYVSSLDKLYMPRLESLQMQLMFPTEFDSWMRFLENHRHLKRLNMQAYSGAINITSRLLALLQDLQELKLECVGYFNEEFISQIIECHESMNKFEFLTNRPTDGGFAALRARFERGWDILDITYYTFSGLSFVRKN